jgi:hypothetical protein
MNYKALQYVLILTINGTFSFQKYVLICSVFTETANDSSSSKQNCLEVVSVAIDCGQDQRSSSLTAGVHSMPRAGPHFLWTTATGKFGA